MAARRPARVRSQLPSCYHEGFLEKKSLKDKIGRKFWTSLCGNSLFFFNNTKDSSYIEKLDLSELNTITDDCCRDRNLDSARFTMHMKTEDIKMVAPSLEARELWKGFILSVSKLSVPTTLNLLPGQIHMMKETIENEKRRQQMLSAPSSNVYLPVVSDMPACYQVVSRAEAEIILERNPEKGNLLLRPGRDGSCFAITTRQDVNGRSVFKHYRVTRKYEGGFAIDIETPITCATLHDVISCLVAKTNGVLEPFLAEEYYEDNITFLQANEENGELSVQRATDSPSPCPPVPPPKPAPRDRRAYSESLTMQNIYLNDPEVREDEVDEGVYLEPSESEPFVPERIPTHQNSVNKDLNASGVRKALKPPGFPKSAPRSFSSQSEIQPLEMSLSDELKMVFKKRRAIQE